MGASTEQTGKALRDFTGTALMQTGPAALGRPVKQEPRLLDPNSAAGAPPLHLLLLHRSQTSLWFAKEIVRKCVSLRRPSSVRKVFCEPSHQTPVPVPVPVPPPPRRSSHTPRPVHLPQAQTDPKDGVIGFNLHGTV